MQSEGPGIGIPVRVQRNLLDDLCSSLGLANDVRWHRGVIHIPLPGNVIKKIGAVSSALPDAQAEVSVECRQYELRCCRAILRAPVGRLDRLVWQTALGHSSRSYGENKRQRAHA